MVKKKKKRWKLANESGAPVFESFTEFYTTVECAVSTFFFFDKIRRDANYLLSAAPKLAEISTGTEENWATGGRREGPRIKNKPPPHPLSHSLHQYMVLSQVYSAVITPLLINK